MRISEDRYSRERLCLQVALRFLEPDRPAEGAGLDWTLPNRLLVKVSPLAAWASFLLAKAVMLFSRSILNDFIFGLL